MMKIVLTVVCACILACVATAAAEGEQGYKYPAFVAKEFTELVETQWEDNGSVTIRKRFRTPRSTGAGNPKLIFSVDELALMNLRVSCAEPTRLADIVYDGNLQGTSGSQVFYQQELKDKILKPGPHEIEVRFWDPARAWYSYDSYQFNDDDRDEPYFWVKLTLIKPTAKQLAKAEELAAQSSTSGQTVTV